MKWCGAMEGRMRESSIERRLVQVVRQHGGLALKLTSPNIAGVPDRLVLLPGGRVVFVELKAPGQKLRPLQQKRKRQLEALGFRVAVIDSREEIDRFIKKEVVP